MTKAERQRKAEMEAMKEKVRAAFLTCDAAATARDEAMVALLKRIRGHVVKVTWDVETDFYMSGDRSAYTDPCDITLHTSGRTIHIGSSADAADIEDDGGLLETLKEASGIDIKQREKREGNETFVRRGLCELAKINPDDYEVFFDVLDSYISTHVLDCRLVLNQEAVDITEGWR